MEIITSIISFFLFFISSSYVNSTASTPQTLHMPFPETAPWSNPMHCFQVQYLQNPTLHDPAKSKSKVQYMAHKYNSFLPQNLLPPIHNRYISHEPQSTLHHRHINGSQLFLKKHSAKLNTPYHWKAKSVICGILVYLLACLNTKCLYSQIGRKK